MGRIGEVFADAGLHIDNASFSEYASKLKAAEGNITNFAAAHSAALIGTGAAMVGLVGGVAAYGVSLASGFQDAGVSLTNLYGSADIAREKFKWMVDFAAQTPFEFKEIQDAAIKLKSFGMDIEDYGRIMGDTAANMGKSINDIVEAYADAGQGEFERLKEFGVKAVVVQNDNLNKYAQYGAKVNDTVLTYTDKTGKQMAQVVDRNNSQMVYSTLNNIFDIEKGFQGAMETRSKTFSGMLSAIKDNLSFGLADLVGYDMATMEVETNSLMSVLMSLAGVAETVTSAFANMPESMQTAITIIGVGAVAAGGLAVGIGLVGAASSLATPGMMALATSINAAIWPATLVVGALALIGIGLYELEVKTGLVSDAWTFMKDVFVIGADYLMRAASALSAWVGEKCEEIRQAIDDMIPDEWAEKIGNIVDKVEGYFGNMSGNVHAKAESLRRDTKNVGDSAIEMGGKIAGTAPSVTTLTDTMAAGTGTVNQFGYAFKTVASDAGAAATSIESAARRIGQAINTTADQVGNVSSLAGKWNLRETPGVVTSRGGRGTGEGNVRIVDTHNMYTDNKNKTLSKSTVVNVGTINNYGESNSQNKKKLKIVSKA
jgi:hypothetical protein